MGGIYETIHKTAGFCTFVKSCRKILTTDLITIDENVLYIKKEKYALDDETGVRTFETAVAFIYDVGRYYIICLKLVETTNGNHIDMFDWTIKHTNSNKDISFNTMNGIITIGDGF